MSDHSGCSPSRSEPSSATSLLKRLVVQVVHVSVGDTGMVLFSVLLTQPLKKTPLFCLLSGKVFKTIDGIFIKSRKCTLRRKAYGKA